MLRNFVAGNRGEIGDACAMFRETGIDQGLFELCNLLKDMNHRKQAFFGRRMVGLVVLSQEGCEAFLGGCDRLDGFREGCVEGVVGSSGGGSVWADQSSGRCGPRE